MRKILVTGATGFIGRHLVSRLVREGRPPRILVRDPAKAQRLLGSVCEVVPGVLPDAAAAAAAVAGVDTVLHLAALATASAPSDDQYERDNVDALRMMLAAAAAAGVARFVHVSTIAVEPPSQPARHLKTAATPTPYAASKTLGEKLVQDYRDAGHDAVIVRPTRVYGPGPWNDANGATRMIAMYLAGRFRFRPDDGDVAANYVHVTDVAQGILQAARHGQGGKAYVLGGENASLREFLDTLAGVSGVRRRTFTVSPRVLAPIAGLGTLWDRCGGCSPLTSAWLNYFLEHRPADISAARTDLGYDPMPLWEGMTATLTWLLAAKKGDRHERKIVVRRREAWS